MTTTRTLFAAALLTAMTTASAAWAGPKIMWSAPAAQIYPGPQALWCDIRNVDTKDRIVTIEVVIITTSVL